MPIVVGSVHGGVNAGEYSVFLNDQRGPVRADLRRRTVLVRTGVTRRCPRRTGRLVSTLRTEDGNTGDKPYTDIVIGQEGKTDYLGYILNGTPAHLIYPRANRTHPHLRFVAGGVVVYAVVVRHPGTRANNFLIKSLDDARG